MRGAGAGAGRGDEESKLEPALLGGVCWAAAAAMQKAVPVLAGGTAGPVCGTADQRERVQQWL